MQVARLFLLLLGVSSCTTCGGTEEQEDAEASTDASGDLDAPDVVTRCTSGPFGAPVPIAELNTSEDERSLRLSSDELTAVFSRGGSNGASPLPDIYVTNRTSSSGTFAPPEDTIAAGVVPNIGGEGCVFPSLTGDGMNLIYESICVFGAGGTYLCLACGDGGESA
jgi:hypothetical protein